MFVQRIGSLTSEKVSSNSNHSNPNVAFAAKTDVPDEFIKGAKQVAKNVEKAVTKSSEEAVPPPPKKRSFLDWFLDGGSDSDPFSPENIQYP